MKILLGPSTFAATDKSPLQKLLNAGFEVIDNPFKRKLTKNELFNLLSSDVIGLIAGLETLDREVMQKSRLKVISRCGSGMSNVDVKAADELGIAVRSTPMGPVESVAELTLAAILNVLRQVSLMDRDLHRGEWNKKNGFLLQGKTVSVVGYGRIGRRLVELLQPFGVTILVVDPFVKAATCSYPVLSLSEALPRSDLVILHASGEECLLGPSELALMKKGSFLFNPARGSLVDEGALVKALESKHIAGVWFDAFAEEPYQGPLTKFDQALLTPHVGSYTAECRLQMETEAVDNLLAVLKK